MATTTTNYNLIKPAANDNYDVADFNANFDAIDAQMKANADAASGAAPSTHSHGDITSDGKYAAPIADEAAMLWCDTDGSIFPRANVETLNALGAQARVLRLTPAGGTAALTLADNTEYRFSSAVTSLTLTYPSGNFDSWVQFTAGDSITVTFPLSTTFIGKTPNFEASKTYEMSIKDGCVICSEVTSE